MILAGIEQPDLDSYQLTDATLAALEPPDGLTVSQWADRYRYLDSKYSAQPGPYRTAATPYMAEIMDACGDPDVAQVIFCKSARVGGTECLNNIMADSIDCNPRPIIYLQLEEGHAKDELSGRVKEMILSSPRLSRHIARSGTGGFDQRWATNTKITLGPCVIYGAWATNQATLVRITGGLLVIDEIGNIVNAVGDYGHFLTLAEKRVQTYDAIQRSTIYANGTPGDQNDAGWAMMLDSDYRTFRVPCPCCGRYQRLIISCVIVHPAADRIVAGKHKPVLNARGFETRASIERTYEKRPSNDLIRELNLARYHCRACDALLTYEDHQRWMIDRGQWVPTGWLIPETYFDLKAKHGDDALLAVQPAHKAQAKPRLLLDPNRDEGREIAVTADGQPTPQTRARRRGYHLSAMYSPYVSWPKIITEFFESKNDPAKFRVFTNAVLGEPWIEAQAELAGSNFTARMNHPDAVPSGTVPWWARALVMGADVQLGYCWFVIRAFGPMMRGPIPVVKSAVILAGRIEGDIAGRGESDLHKLYKIAFRRPFQVAPPPEGMPKVYPTDAHMVCRAIAMDSGYNERRDEVELFCKQFPGVIPVRGQGHESKSWKMETGGGFGWSSASGIRTLMVNRHTYFDRMHRLYSIDPNDPESIDLPTDLYPDYVTHMTNIKRVLVPKKIGGKHAGRSEMRWVDRTASARTDLPDCEVYLSAAADALGISGVMSTLHLDPCTELVNPAGKPY